MFAGQVVLDEVEAAVDRAVEVGLDDATPLEVETAVLALARLKAKVAALDAMVSRRFETDGRWALVGALNPAAFVAAKTRTPSSTCRRPFTLGRKHGQLPGLAVALAAGAITLQHRDKILAVDNPRVHDAFVADHVQFIRWAMELSWDDFTANLRDWLEEHDPDGPDPAIGRRRFDLDEGFDGTWTPNGTLDPITGQNVRTELDRLERLLFEHDWNEARERLGREPVAGDLARTGAQRRHDALALMAERSATLPDDGRRGRYLFTVLLGEPTFDRLCRLASGQPVRPGSLLPFLGDQAVVEMIKYQGPFHAVEASGRRNFEGILRRASLAPHQRCFHPYCDIPVSACEADHNKPHSKGGPTSQENCQPGCPGHNRHKADHDPTATDTDPITDVVDDP